MKKKVVIDLIVSIILLILASIILLLPTFRIKDVKMVLLMIFSIYAALKFIQFIFIFKERDFESLFTGFISLLGFVSLLFVKITTQKLVLILLVWMGVMSLIKLKKADFYHDRENKMWILRLFMLFVFLVSGLLMGMNLAYERTVQITIIGFFFFINSLLDTIDPIVIYLLGDKKWN